MDTRALPRILRIEGLIPFTLCAILIGFVVSLWEAGFKAADWSLFFIAAVTAVLIHIDGHLWNDIMDIEIDRREKSRETGRDRPLVYGWATVREYRTISAIRHRCDYRPCCIHHDLQGVHSAPDNPRFLL